MLNVQCNIYDLIFKFNRDIKKFLATGKDLKQMYYNHIKFHISIIYRCV